MIKKILLLATVFYSTISLAQVPAIEWQKTLGGSSFEYAYSVQQTTDGGYIVAGLAVSSNGDVTGNHGASDFWVVKLSSSGVLEWQKNLGGTGYESARSIQQSTDGGYIVAGYTTSNDGDATGNHGASDFWVVKLSSSGVLEWQKTFGGTNDDTARSIQQTTDGGYIVSGSTASNDGNVIGNHGGRDVWVVKLSSSGNLEWQKTLGGTNNDDATSIHQTIDGGYIMIGGTESNGGDVIGNHGFIDTWVVKLSVAGTLEWQKTLGGTGYDYARSIQQTTDGGYIVAYDEGFYSSGLSGNHGQGTVWAVKLSTVGVLEWQKSFGGSSDDRASSIRQTTDGGYILLGYTDSINGDVTGNHGWYDFWLIKLSPLGVLKWQKTLGGSSDEEAESIQQTTDGGYIVAGYTYETINDGDVTGGHGQTDFWVVKLGPEPELATENFDKKNCIIYPNPTTNTLHIQTNQAIDKITITDVTGKKVMEQNTVSNQIDVQDLQQGIYILQFFSRGKTFVEKFVKE